VRTNAAGRMTVKARTGEGFGPRLATIRKGRGLSQERLGEAVGVSQRVITYYEAEGAQPPGPMLPDRARALGVSTDELLGLEPIRDDVASPRAARLLERLKAAADLPPHDQKGVLNNNPAAKNTAGLLRAFAADEL
jgi:transcriptional regulator with XRE-family HTH domain